MGVQLFLDILRSLNPTHVIRLMLSQRSNEDCLKVLPQLTEEFLTSTPGLFTPPDRGTSAQGTPESGCYFNPCSSVGGTSLCGGVRMMGVQRVAIPSRVTGGHEGASAAPVGGPKGLRGGSEGAFPGEGGETSIREENRESSYPSSDIEMYGSSEEEFSITESRYVLVCVCVCVCVCVQASSISPSLPLFFTFLLSSAPFLLPSFPPPLIPLHPLSPLPPSPLLPPSSFSSYPLPLSPHVVERR